MTPAPATAEARSAHAIPKCLNPITSPDLPPHVAGRIEPARNGSLFRQCKTQNEIAAAASALPAARRDGDELLTVQHVGGGRREHAGPGVELPELLAGLCVQRVEVTSEIAA